ncbi:MAG: NAD(P)/FAD-dependent oxidoreductase [Desulfobacterales bacterium]
MTRRNAYDAIIIGAGHNGLTAAALLAKQGRNVLILERRCIIGGLAAGEEFHPGYHTVGLLHDVSQIRARVVRALNLKSHGLQILSQRPAGLALDPGGRGILLGNKDRQTAKEIGFYSPEDAGRYLKYRKFIKRVAGVVNRIFDKPPAAPTDHRMLWHLFKTGFALRRLGKTTMFKLLGAAPMSAADWLDQWFETGCLKCGLANAGLGGSFAGPRSPGSAFNLLLWECAARHHIRSGPQALIDALEKAAKSYGVEIKTESEVSEIEVFEGRVRGVVLKKGERIPAAVVAASCDPRHTFLDLVPGHQIESRLKRRIQHIRGTGSTAKVNLALDTQLQFSGRAGEKIAFARTGRTLDQIEKAFDACKNGRYAADPILDIHVASASDPDLAPPGHSVVSILVHFVPYDLRPQWDRDQIEKLGDSVVAALEQYAPGVSNAIVARQVLSPVDLEARYGLKRGHIFHGEHALDQLILRPSPECARYHTPIEGLYLCGSGSHPGGGITCAPGALAASAVAKA